MTSANEPSGSKCIATCRVFPDAPANRLAHEHALFQALMHKNCCLEDERTVFPGPAPAPAAGVLVAAVADDAAAAAPAPAPPSGLGGRAAEEKGPVNGTRTTVSRDLQATVLHMEASLRSRTPTVSSPLPIDPMLPTPPPLVLSAPPSPVLHRTENASMLSKHSRTRAGHRLVFPPNCISRRAKRVHTPHGVCIL